MRRKPLFNAFEREVARSGCGLRRLERIPAAAVIGGNIEMHAAPRRCGFLRVVDGALKVFRECIPVPDDADADARLQQGLFPAGKGGREDFHEGGHFRRGTTPVFTRKGKDGKRPDAEAHRRLHHAFEREHPLAMAFRTRKKPRSRPTAVAVHDDRNVSGQVRKVSHDGCTEMIKAAESLAKAHCLSCDGLQASRCVSQSRGIPYSCLMLPHIRLN